jgi:hypothetical protein
LLIALLVGHLSLLNFHSVLNGAIEKFFEPIAKQKTYKSGLTKSLEDVRKHTSRIKEVAQQCLAARNANIDKNVIELLHKVDTLPKKIEVKVAQTLYRLLQSSNLYSNKVYGTSS